MDEAIPSGRSVPGSEGLSGIVGRSPAIRSVLQEARDLAPSSLPILILGETGTGKEILARAIHVESGRASFLPVNIAAISEHLVSSELFGHARGAFTGADQDRSGLFEAAEGGTLFLDEIGEASLPTQVALLRALDTGTIRPVGTNKIRRVDVRVILATNRDLTEDLRSGRFREDLYARLEAFSIVLPPLRERHGDINHLVRHFLNEHPITPEALELLRQFRWPRNVRELELELEKARVLAHGEPIGPAHLSRKIIVVAEATGSPPKGSDWPTLESVQRKHILRTVRRFDGNRTRSAEALAIHRNTLVRKLKKYGIQDEE